MIAVTARRESRDADERVRHAAHRGDDDDATSFRPRADDVGHAAKARRIRQAGAAEFVNDGGRRCFAHGVGRAASFRGISASRIAASYASAAKMIDPCLRSSGFMRSIVSMFVW